MTGSGGSRSDWGSNSGSGSAAGGGAGAGSGGLGVADPCLKPRRGPINSPQSSVLARLRVGDTLSVRVDNTGSRSVLVVADSTGAIAGSLTFIGYLEIIDCILNRGIVYQATIISISGGIHEVRVEAVA